MIESDQSTTLRYRCQHCNIPFENNEKLDDHHQLYHQAQLPGGSTLRTYLVTPESRSESEHQLVEEVLPRPKQCTVCEQVIWEVAMWCPHCRVTCHRACSTKLSTFCPNTPPNDIQKPKDHPGSVRTLGNLLRRKVGENKMRLVDEKFDLDVSYILPRVIAMSFPSKGLESLYRNRIQDVADYLDSKHKDNYLIINVSDRTYDTNVFKNQVLEFGWPDHHAPPVNTLCCIVKTMDSWLREDSNHVIVVHCKGGKGRTGCAIAAYIQFNNTCLTATEALDKFAVKRFYDESLGGVTQPSQRRIVHYFSSLIKNEVRLENRQLTLNAIILFGCPEMDGKNGAKICFCVYEGFKPVYTTSVYGLTLDRERVYISLNNLKVQSDVMVKAFHISKTGKTCIMRVQFHTAFVSNDFNLVFRKKDMDIACRDDRFPNDGVLQLMFKPEASVITDDIDSIAHKSLTTDIKEAKEIEEMSKNVSLMSFEYADYTSFFTDNPISELKQNEMLDKILTLHDDYKLITPLQPFHVPNQPPPIPPKVKTKDSLPASKKHHAQTSDSTAAPHLPPRKFKPAPIELPKSQERGGPVDGDDEYVRFETATPVKELVTHFEREDELNNFDNWVKFDEDADDEPLINLSTSSDPFGDAKNEPEAQKIALTNTKSVPNNSNSNVQSTGSLSRSRSWDRDKNNNVTMDKNAKRSSSYIPYVQRKSSVKKDRKGNKIYIPYCQRNTSIDSSHSSTSSSSPLFQSPPPLPPRGTKIAPGPSSGANSNEPDLLAPRVSRIPSLSKSMDNLPLLTKATTTNNKVPILLDSPESGDPKTIEYSLINWEKVQLRKIIRQTKPIWFRPDISRQESQATLVSQCPGAFIIRVSQTLKECYGLTIRLEDGKKHEDFNLHPGSHKVSNFLIQKNSKGGLYINGYGGVDFMCLEDLVEFFTNHTGGLPHPLKVPTQPYTDRVDEVVPMLLRNVSFPVFILEKRMIRYLPLDSFEEDNVKSLLTETIAAVKIHDIRLISMSVTKHGIHLTDPDCLLFDCYTIPYKQIRNCEVGNKDQTIPLPLQFHKQREITATFGLIHRDEHDEIIYIALAEFEDSGISITKTINKFRSYLV